MPSFEHEAPLVLLRARPDLVATLVRDSLGMPVPDFADARIADADFSQLLPTEFRADLVVELCDADGAPVLAVIVELQRSRDDDKRRTWPLYAAALHARVACQTCLLVLTDDAAVAAWARKPIHSIQPGSPFYPLVLGPHEFPHSIDPATAARIPELAVLTALAHANDPDAIQLTLAALDSVIQLDHQRARLYYDIILGALDDSARRALEAFMSTDQQRFYSSFARDNFEQGIEQGIEQGGVLASRGILRQLVEHKLGQLPAAIAQRIDACSDLEQLSRWIVAVGTTTEHTAIRALF